jgi:hypothetical protein
VGIVGLRKQVLALYGLIILTLIVIAVAIWAPRSKTWVIHVVSEQLTKYLEAPVTFSDIHFGFFPPSVEFENIEFKKEDSPLEYVSSGKIKLTLGLAPSVSGKIRIKNVDIIQPTLKFNFSKFKFEQKEKKEKKKKFRLPTLKDILKVQIDQIQISKTALSFEFPGKYFLEIDSETAGYRREKKSEIWTWKGSGLVKKNGNTQVIEKVDIEARRTGQTIEIQQLVINGTKNSLGIRGEAYPKANLIVKINGETDDLMETLKDMDLIKKKILLSGDYKIETRLMGPWDDVNQDGKVELNKLNFEGRKFDLVRVNYQVRKNQLKAADGSVEVNSTKVGFNLSNIIDNKKAQFVVHAENVNYGDVQRSIDPVIEPILQSHLNVDAKGEIQIQPFEAKATYQVSGPKITFDFPPMLTPYLPLELKQIEAEGTMKWNMQEGCLLEGPIKTLGMNGSYKFSFPEVGIVDGTWDFGVNRFGDLFTKDYPVVGKGKVTGGLKAVHSELKALFSLDIKDLQYNRHEKSSLSGDLIFTEKGTEVSNVQILTNNKRGSAFFNGTFGHGLEGNTSVEGKVKDFNLGWVSDMVSRRFPFVAGIQGRGSSTVSLNGPTEKIEGSILFNSDNLDWKGEHLEKVSAKMSVTPTGLELEDIRLASEGFDVSAKGSIANDEYRGLIVKLNKVPIALLNTPTWLSNYVSKIDANLYLDGPLDNPQIKSDGRMYQPNLESTALSNAGTFSTKGTASNLAWEVDAFEKSLLASGVLQLGSKTAMQASGTMNKFNILPRTSSFITGKWNFSGDFDQIRTWNAEMAVDTFEIRNNKFTYKTKAPFQLTARQGIFHLTPFKLGDRDGDVVISGSTDVNENLDFKMKGKMPIALLTLLPLKLNRAEGLADVDVSWTGKLTNPVLNGKFHAKNAYVQTLLFPHAIEDLEMVADIEQNRIKAQFFKGKMADGKIEGRGDLYLPTSNSDMRIFLNGTVDEAWLRFPEWLPVLVSGNFILSGNLSKPMLKGDFTILEGTYKDEWDWKKQILTIGKTARTARIYRKEEEGLQYDLSFRSNNGKFYLRNQVAFATMKGDLRVLGTNANVGLLGQIEILDGEVVFLDRKFKLAPGVVNFTNPNELKMAFDLNATTTVENVDIYLDIRTEQDQIRAYLSSNPVKDETSIISLLTLGVELNDLAVTSNADQGVSMSLLPSVLSGPVQSRVETGLRKIKLIDTFQFIPYFSENTKTTSMRLLVGKQLYSKVRLSYSTDLFDTGLDNIFALEHLVNNNVKLMGSVRDNRLESEQDYDVGFDVEFRFDF